MGKVRKKRGIKFDYDRKRNKNKRKKPKDMPSIKCDEIKKAWDVTKNVKQNLAEMGISYDPNKSVKAGKKKKMVAVLDDDKNWNFEEMEPDVEKTPIKKYVIDDLEMKSKIPGKKKIWISQNDADFCVYMMDKYGDNYIKMARDDKNYYQETPKQIERKINKFKSVPKMFEAYMNRKKGEPSIFGKFD